ncbi:MAG TPA: DUF4124 domain-containing protein, partial [Burkholderiales bacterium]
TGRRGNLGLLTRLHPLVMLAAMLFPSALSAEVYKWVDEHGVTHYSDTPPDTGKAGKVQVPPRLPADSGGEARARKESDDARRAEVGRRRLRDVHEGADAAARMSRDARETRCMQAREQLEALIRGGPVYLRDETGRRVYLEDSLRDAEIARAQREFHAACGDGPGDRASPGSVERSPEDSDRERCLKARDRLAELEQPSMRSPNADLREAREAVNRLCGPQP